MKKCILTLVLAVFVAGWSFAQSTLGIYSSDFNELTILVNGNLVTGTYKHQNGRIEGTLNGNTLTGVWIQSNGKGKFVFEFKNDFSAFTGKWGYNDATPNSQWNGSRISGSYNPVSASVGAFSGVFNSDFNELTIQQDGNHITGTYKHRSGRIEGTANGPTITGVWTQDNGKGRFNFEFNSDFSVFNGKWGYNDATPSSQWNGTRIGGVSSLPPAAVIDIQGVYTSDFSELTIVQNGSSVTGTYKHRNGRIEGTLNGKILSGNWVQDNGKGKMIFEFKEDGSGFTGKWGYNDGEPTSQWNGSRISGGGTSSVSRPNPVSRPASVPPVKSATPAGPATATATPLSVEVNNTSDLLAGDLVKNGIQIELKGGTFGQKVNLQAGEAADVAPFEKQRAVALGTPFEITIDQESKRLNKPVKVRLKLLKQEVAALEHAGDLWMGYFNGKKWDYFRPLEVNLKDAYVKFETFHFSLFCKAAPTKEERINDIAFKNAVNQWAQKDNNGMTRQATEQIVSEILARKMGLTDKSLAQDVVEAILKENDYTSLMVSYNDGRIEDFSQDLSVLAGKKIFEIVTTDSNAKALLGKVTEHSSKIGAGIKIAVALSNGDGEAAAKELSREILNTFPLTKMLSTAAEITERQINRWRDQELEAAYQVFVKGAESSVPWWGYQVEPGNFDQVWEQMRGLETKLLDDAIKNYAASKNMHPNDLNSVIKDKIRRDTKEEFRQVFMKRKQQEAQIETIKDDNLKLVKEFEAANLLTRYRFGYDEKLSMDARLEQLFTIKEMVLKDTKSKLGFSGINQGGVISSKTVANLIQLWYSSENGPEKYRQELVKLGYRKETIAQPAKVSVSQPASAPGNDIEGIYVGTIGHTDLLDYWGKPRFEWISGVKEFPMIFVVYNAKVSSDKDFRILSMQPSGTVGYGHLSSYMSDDIDLLMPGFANNRFNYRKEIGYQDGVVNGEKKAYRIWSATKLSSLDAPVAYPAKVSLKSLEEQFVAYHKASVVPDQTEVAAASLEEYGRKKIDEIRRLLFLATPAFQKAAIIWLRDKNYTSHPRWDERKFKELFLELLKKDGLSFDE